MSKYKIIRFLLLSFLMVVVVSCSGNFLSSDTNNEKVNITVNFKLGSTVMEVSTNGVVSVFNSNIIVPYGQNVGTYLDSFVINSETRLRVELPSGATITPGLTNVSGSGYTNTKRFQVTYNEIYMSMEYTSLTKWERPQQVEIQEEVRSLIVVPKNI